MAEYIELVLGPGVLGDRLKATLINTTPDDVPEYHRQLAALPTREYWTTNYDWLLEMACSDAVVLATEEDVRHRSLLKRAVIKVHGSLDRETRDWTSPPVMTRTSFERFEWDCPRTWALLRASYLSRTMLFVGFSFSDPNIGLLLKLARTYRTSVADRHLAVMRRPKERLAARAFELQVKDLEASGIQICEIEEYDDLGQILSSLVRRTRPASYFVSGSAEQATDLEPWAIALAQHLAPLGELQTKSLGGTAGWLVTRDVARLRKEAGTYRAEQLVIHFRQSPAAPPPMDERIGQITYTDMDREAMARALLGSSRAMLVLRGRGRTAEEIRWARELGVDVVPLASSGGAAREYWQAEASRGPNIAGQRVTTEDWELLNHSDVQTAVGAAVDLLKRATFTT